MGSEILRSVLADERSAHLLTTPAETRELDRKVRITSREWLGIHVMVYLIIVWNLFAIDLARTPGNWWFWIPAAVWAGALAVHAVWLVSDRRWVFARRARSVVSREEGGR